MYLKKVYQYNKLLFVLIVLFTAAQLINNIRQDIAISPFYSYGMYSEQIRPFNIYRVPEVFINGEQLSAKSFSPPQWDNITFPVSRFYEQRGWNLALWQQDVHRLLPFADSTKYTNTITEEQFKRWYKVHIQSLLHEQVDSVNIVFTDYFFTGTAFIKK